MMANDPNHEDLNRHLVRALDEAISEGRWDSGLFLRVIGKRLTSLRDRLMNELVFDKQTQSQLKAHDEQTHAEEGMRRVCVMLYHADGEKINNWLPMLRDLSHFSIGRPVYTTEMDAQAFIRTKRDPSKNAYVFVRVAEEACLSEVGGQSSNDKDGRAVLLLKKGSLNVDNIEFFVHASGRYRLDADGLHIVEAN